MHIAGSGAFGIEVFDTAQLCVTRQYILASRHGRHCRGGVDDVEINNNLAWENIKQGPHQSRALLRRAVPPAVMIRKIWCQWPRNLYVE